MFTLRDYGDRSRPDQKATGGDTIESLLGRSHRRPPDWDVTQHECPPKERDLRQFFVTPNKLSATWPA